MATSEIDKIKSTTITSTNITGFSGGLNLLGEQNAKPNQFVESRNVIITSDGKLTQRWSKRKWLPDTVGTVYQVSTHISPVNGGLIHLVADDGKIKWCKPGDTTWTDCGGTNSITTGFKVKNTFLRALDKVAIMNGVDKVCWVDLKTMNVVKATPIDDPTTAPTAVNTGAGLNGNKYTIYYAYTFSSATGETKVSEILSHPIDKPRDIWDSKTEYVTITRPNNNPTGAVCWNLYIALASNGGTIQDTDMLMVAGGLDMNTLSVVDNGLLAIDIGRGTAPEENSTDGFVAQHGIETNGRPVLFGDGHNIWIGGNGDHAWNFSPTNGGYRSTPSAGTNYYPTSVVGFRNSQGIPSLTILFSNTEGLSKQALLEQQTINYGDQSFGVWGVTEQNYGAAGITSFYSVVNYKGALTFASTDGILKMDTQPQLQNVLSTNTTTTLIAPYVRNIKTDALAEIIGTAWSDRLYFLMPSAGFETPNEILICDLKNNNAFYTLNVPAQWIGTVSPADNPAFVYICQGNKIYKLHVTYGTIDGEGENSEIFSCYAKGALIGFNDAHNSYAAVIQAVFYVSNLIGEITFGVNYRDEFGKMKTKKKTFYGPPYSQSPSGGWGDAQWTYRVAPSWGEVASIDTSELNMQKVTKRCVLPLDVITSEVQWWYETPLEPTSHQLDFVSYEGQNLGIKPDIR